MSLAWTKGDWRAKKQLEKSLSSDQDDHVTRFALVRLLASKAEPAAAEELLRGPGVEDRLLADPNTRVAMLSSLGGAYLMLWRARGETTSESTGSRAGGGQGKDTREVVEIRLDVSSERTDLLHRAQHFLEEALMSPENLNDPAIRAQVGERGKWKSVLRLPGLARLPPSRLSLFRPDIRSLLHPDCCAFKKAFCKEARGDYKEALTLYASIISDSALSPGASAVIFRTSVLLAYVGRLDECVRYLEFIEGQPPKGCSMLLVQALLYTCYVSLGLEVKVSRRLITLREAYNDEYTAGRMGRGFSRDEIPWDRLPGWFYMWRELGVESIRAGNYYAGIQMFSQATLQRQDPETMVCTAEMLWVLGEPKRALALCERAYAADPLHIGAQRRLSGWAPQKWKERIVKEEERREAITEMRRLADLSDKKADAMLARRRRREKARFLRAWRRLHDKHKHRRSTSTEGEEAQTGRRRRDDTTTSKSSGSDKFSWSDSSSSRSGSSSSSGSARFSHSGGSSSRSDRSSSFASSLSAKEQVERSVDEKSSASSAPVPEPFPVPSAAEAAEAGRSNFSACFRAETERAMRRKREATEHHGEMPMDMASVKVAAEAIHEAMRGGGWKTGTNGARSGFATHEMRALARFQCHRKTHEAKITKVVYGS
ncbi:unnamed protein product [Ectocarpus sp. CCAP 1310/34]|nr:unnamed protein product [Ectocarpus sp. CCAP 1310/34]